MLEPLLQLPVLFALFSIATASYKDIEVELNSSQIIQRYGYPVEVHEVPTDDGWILNLVRIPYGKKETTKKARSPKSCRPAILFLHGLVSDATQFVLNPPETGTGFVFADGGFDVFLPSHRGSAESQKHRVYNRDMPSFWNFSLDEYATKDMPAFVDAALSISKRQSIYVVGLSQGITVLLSFLATFPEYNSKINAVFGWGTVSPAYNNTGLKDVLPVMDRLLKVTTSSGDALKQLKPLKKGEVSMSPVGLPKDKALALAGMAELVCHPPRNDKRCVRRYIWKFSGKSPAPYNTTRIPVYAAHIWSETSSKNLQYWLQAVNTPGGNRHYNYGPAGNMVMYGQREPPPYDLSKVDVPVYLMWGDHDILGNIREQDDVMKRLSKAPVKKIKITAFAHVDFVLSMNAPKKVYHPMMKIIRRLEKKRSGC